LADEAAPGGSSTRATRRHQMMCRDTAEATMPS
jgi:hypothetical protein